MSPGTKAGGGTGSHLPAALESRTGRARPLDASVRGAMERSFGTSLGEVVVHTDAEAAASAERLDAKAYAVGRHVVFGPGRYDPHSDAGRALIGHELAHVVQQRRGGARPGTDGVHPAGSAAEGAAHSAGARAAAGLSASVGGGTAPGVSRAPKDEEDPEIARLKAENRASDMRNLGVVEGVLLEGAGIVDTLVGFGYSVHDLGQRGVDDLTSDLDLSPANKARLRAASDVLTGRPVFDALRDRAKAAELYDATTRSPAVSSLVTSAGDWLEKKYDETLGTTKPVNDDLFTDRELYEIFGQLGAKTVLTALDVEAVKTLLATVNVLGAVRAILVAYDKIPHGRPPTREFWTAVVAAVLTVAGMRAGGANKKIARVLIDLALAAVTLEPLVERIAQDRARAPGADRDAALKQDAKDLAKAVLALLHQVLLQAAASRRAGSGAGQPAAGGPGDGPGVGKRDSTTAGQPSGSRTQAGRAPEPAHTPSAVPAPPGTAHVVPPPTPALPTPALPAAAPKPTTAKPGTVKPGTKKVVTAKLGAKRPGTEKSAGEGPSAAAIPNTTTVGAGVPAAGTPETAGTGSVNAAPGQASPGGKATTPKTAAMKAPADKTPVGETTHAPAVTEPALGTPTSTSAKKAAAKSKADAAVARKVATAQKRAAAKEAAAKKRAAAKEVTAAKKAAAKEAAAAKKAAEPAEPAKPAKPAAPTKTVTDASNTVSEEVGTAATKSVTIKVQSPVATAPGGSGGSGISGVPGTISVPKSVKAAKKAARQDPNAPFDPKARRPSLRGLKDLKPAAVDRHTGVVTNSDARVFVFHDPLGSRVAPVSGATAQSRGHDLERAVKEDAGLGGVTHRQRHDAGDRPRIGDLGTYEIKNVAELGSKEYDQVWRDLVAYDEAHIIMPKAGPHTIDNLALMAALFERMTGRRPTIAVRETSP
ncbi:DUF4157 domain-containing protein [Embleya sp. NPDC008237]|uniref:eCIS core domain-containing protein n=1 Tax=Embleya sp. NPDC008237 TaxID=3363978 RepID=UPI0036ECD8F3